MFKYSNVEADRWPATPLVRQLLSPEKREQHSDNSDQHYSASIRYTLPEMSSREFSDYPFLKIRDLFESADIGFVNLEMPLATSGRKVGDFRGDPIFAESMSTSGISLVSLANNHMLDAEGAGLLETISTLRRVHVDVIGAGVDLAAARQPRIKDVADISIGFLAYSQIPGEQFGRSFATMSRAGIAPLDPTLVCEDVAQLRSQVDHIVVSLHWGREHSSKIHPEARSLARRIIDSGADIILGHHPHVPQGIEIYNHRYIVYSMGNLIFGHNHEYWTDNIMIEATFSKQQIENFNVYPIAGRGTDLSQPFLLTGDRGKHALAKIRL